MLHHCSIGPIICRNHQLVHGETRDLSPDLLRELCPRTPVGDFHSRLPADPSSQILDSPLKPTLRSSLDDSLLTPDLLNKILYARVATQPTFIATSLQMQLNRSYQPSTPPSPLPSHHFVLTAVGSWLVGFP